MSALFAMGRRTREDNKVGGWRGDFFMRERELRRIVRYDESGFCVWCFFAASGVKKVFSTSSYVEK